MVVVGGVLRSRRNILAGAAVEHIQLRDGAHRHDLVAKVGVVVFLRDAREQARLEPGKLLAHVIRLAWHIGAGIHHQHIAGGGLIIAILAGLFVGLVAEHAWGNSIVKEKSIMAPGFETQH